MCGGWAYFYACVHAKSSHMCASSSWQHTGEATKRGGKFSLFILFGFPKKVTVSSPIFKSSSLYTHNNKLPPPLLLAAALFPWQQQELISLSCSHAKGAGGRVFCVHTCFPACACVYMCTWHIYSTHTHSHTNGVIKRENDYPYLALLDGFVLSVPQKWIVANIYPSILVKV